MRRFYFGLTGLWGFLMGGAAMVLAAAMQGHALRLGPGLAVVALGGAALAMVGAVFAAAAYRHARRR